MESTAPNVHEPLWLCLVKLARLRYLQFAVVPFAIGFLKSGNRPGSNLAWGLLAILFWFIVTEYTNMVSDRAEDSIDYPERTALCTRVGYRRLAYIAAGASLAYVCIASVMLALHILGHLLYPIALLYLAGTVNYSFGIRVKTRPFASALLMGAYQAGFLLTGWIYGGGQIMVNSGEVLFSTILLFAFGVTLAGWKDLPSFEGDSKVGYHSMYWRLFSGRYADVRAIGLLAVPYLLNMLLVAVDGVPPHYMLILLLLPLALAVAMVIARAQTLAQRRAAREIGTIYLLLSMDALLVALYPTGTTVWIVLAGSLCYLLAGRILHPDPEEVFSLSQARAVLDMLQPGRVRLRRRSGDMGRSTPPVP